MSLISLLRSSLTSCNGAALAMVYNLWVLSRFRYYFVAY